MTEYKIGKGSNLSQDNNVQLALEMAELQLKYLFHVLEKGLEKDFEKALSGYTSIVSVIQKPPSFNEKNADWQFALNSMREKYLKFICRSDGTAFARESMKIITPFISCSALIVPPAHQWFGCFCYDYVPERKHIYLHFKNACMPESPFAFPDDRISELVAVIKDIQTKSFVPETIGCNSWLNELAVFQSFFPREYSQSFMVSPQDSKGGYGWWGQFVTKEGRFNKSKAEQFEKNMTFQFQRIIAQCAYSAFVRHVSVAKDICFHKTRL
ncbi:MAG: hypothetical protein WCV67_06325 [Victivallaceae bacterium]|jgi:hypothetical protein